MQVMLLSISNQKRMTTVELHFTSYPNALSESYIDTSVRCLFPISSFLIGWNFFFYFLSTNFMISLHVNDFSLLHLLDDDTRKKGLKF